PGRRRRGGRARRRGRRGRGRRRHGVARPVHDHPGRRGRTGRQERRGRRRGGRCRGRGRGRRGGAHPGVAEVHVQEGLAPRDGDRPGIGRRRPPAAGQHLHDLVVPRPQAVEHIETVVPVAVGRGRGDQLGVGGVVDVEQLDGPAGQPTLAVVLTTVAVLVV